MSSSSLLGPSSTISEMEVSSKRLALGEAGESGHGAREEGEEREEGEKEGKEEEEKANTTE